MPANCTSCCVNWLVSSGSSGFWFWSCVVSSVRKVWKLSAIPVVAVDPELLLVAVPVPGAETTVVGVVASTAMAISLNPDVDAAARTEHAAIAAAGDDGRHAVFLADDEAMRVGIGLVAVVLPLRGLVAQAELQATIAGRESGAVECALQLVGVLTQHRQRFRPFDGQMRRHLAVAVDIDADVDAAEFGGIEANFEAGLATLRGRGDFHRKSAHRHRRICGSRGGELGSRCRRRGGSGRLLRLDRAGNLQAVAGGIDWRLPDIGGGKMRVGLGVSGRRDGIA